MYEKIGFKTGQVLTAEALDHMEEGIGEAQAMVHFPDEEDITSEGNLLKLKDRPADDGMGYVILRKDKTFAEQVTKENTIYEIRYDFELGSKFNLPKNTSLNFQGGKLINGTLVGNNSTIYSPTVHIVDNCTFEGAWTNLTANLVWWGARQGSEFDNSPIIRQAMNSMFPIIEVSGAYYMNSPVELAYNKVIKGRAAHHNEITGFYASDNFAPMQVSFPARGGKGAFTQLVKGIFYHRDAAKSEMYDVFINARHKAAYCIEHIDLYGSTDLYNCYITGANEVGILQYACENPVFDKLYIKDCNIGMYISTQKYKGGNPLSPSFFTGDTMGMPNMVTGYNVHILSCNYGLIVNGCYDFRISNLATSYNSCVGAIVANTTGEINKYYSEGDGRSNFFIHSSGVKEVAADGQSLSYLVTNNLDGISSTATISMGKPVYVRGSLYNYKSRLEITSAYMSFYARSYNHTSAGYVLMDKRDAQGVDCCIVNNEGIVNVDILRLYNHPNDTEGDNLYSAIITLSNYGNDMVNVEYCDRRGVNSIIAPIQALYFNPNKKQMFNQQHSVQKFNPSDYNYNIEDARRNYANDNERTCKYFGQYKNRPLYYYGEGNRKAIWFTKEELSSFFPNKKMIQVYMVVRVLNKASLAPNIAITYFGEDNAALYFFSNNVLGAMQLEEGVYEFVQYFPIETTFDYHHVSINSNLDNNQNYVVSHLYFYDVEDAVCPPHNFTSVVLERGTKRPTISYEGQEFYDMNLHKIIYAKPSLDGWVDATGTTV